MNKTETTKKRPLVSVVLPAYNEERIITGNLNILGDYMKSLEDEYRWEFYIINDGSSDTTGDLADAFAEGKDNVHVLHHMFNFRLGQALRTAFFNCLGDYIVVMDIDLSYSPEHIGQMLAKIRESRAKIIIASPYAKGGKVSHVPWIRRRLSVWANRFLCLMATKDWFSDRLTNITGMVRAYDGEFLRRLNLSAMDVDIMPEIIFKAKILRARIVEIPAHLKWIPEKSRANHIKKRKSSMRIVRSILQSLVSGFILRPFMFFILPGLLIFFLSLYPLAWTVAHTLREYNKLAESGFSFDYRFSAAIGAAFRLAPHSFIIGGIALLVAIQFISLGLLALQNKRYFDELFYLGSTIYRDPRQPKNHNTT
jgi:glycosyltransferase involved in cell wall biosynthesis